MWRQKTGLSSLICMTELVFIRAENAKLKSSISRFIICNHESDFSRVEQNSGGCIDDNFNTRVVIELK